MIGGFLGVFMPLIATSGLCRRSPSGSSLGGATGANGRSAAVRVGDAPSRLASARSALS